MVRSAPSALGMAQNPDARDALSTHFRPKSKSSSCGSPPRDGCEGGGRKREAQGSRVLCNPLRRWLRFSERVL